MSDAFIDEEKSLACVHCGLCLSACPTYLETGNENDSPRGRIHLMRAIQDERTTISGVTVRHIDLCLGCRACEAACPSGVQYGNLLEHTRNHLERKHKRGIFQTLLRRIAIEQIFPFPWRLRIILTLCSVIKLRPFWWIIPKFARDPLTLIPDNYSNGSLAPTSPPSKDKLGRVGFIEGCVMQVMFADTNKSSVKLLGQTGWQVETPKGQCCCGALYVHSGQLEKARECAKRNIETFKNLEVDIIITNAAGCGSTLKEYGELLADDPEWHKRGQRFSARVKDLTEWLETSSFSINHGIPKVTYHDACHLAHPQGITLKPRDLVKSVAGDQFVELPEAEICCGSAGSYNLTEQEMAERLQKRKINNILSTGADILVTSNPGCMLQIQSGLRKAGSHIRVQHIADFLTEHA